MNNFFPKLTLLSVGAVLCFAAIDANLVQAATLTQTINPTFELAGSSVYLDYRATGNFTQFDPRLGTLTDVSLSVSDGTGTITVGCPSYTFACAPNGEVQSELGSSTSPILSLTSGVGIPPAAVGTTSSNPINISQSGTASSITPFIDFSSIPFQSDLFIFFPRQQADISASGTEEATLTYTYSVPEPSDNPILEVAVTLGIGKLLLRKKVARSTQ